MGTQPSRRARAGQAAFGRVVAVLVLSATLATGCHGAGPARSSASSAKVDGGAVNLRGPGDVAVHAEPGVLPAGKVDIVADTAPEGTGAIPNGPVVRITSSGGEPSGNVDLEFPKPAADALIGFYDEATGLWLAVETEDRGDHVVAHVDHLSLWSLIPKAFVDDLGRRFDWFSFQVLKLLGTRKDWVACHDDPPSWATSFDHADTNDAQARLRACASRGSPDANRLVVHVLNNRGYGTTVRLKDIGGKPYALAEAQIGAPTTLKSVAEALAAKVGGAPNEVFLFPLAAGDIAFPTPAERQGSINALDQPRPVDLVVHVVFETLAASHVIDLIPGGGAGVAIAECIAGALKDHDLLTKELDAAPLDVVVSATKKALDCTAATVRQAIEDVRGQAMEEIRAGNPNGPAQAVLQKLTGVVRVFSYLHLASVLSTVLDVALVDSRNTTAADFSVSFRRPYASPPDDLVTAAAGCQSARCDVAARLDDVALHPSGNATMAVVRFIGAGRTANQPDAFRFVVVKEGGELLWRSPDLLQWVKLGSLRQAGNGQIAAAFETGGNLITSVLYLLSVGSDGTVTNFGPTQTGSALVPFSNASLDAAGAIVSRILHRVGGTGDGPVVESTFVFDGKQYRLTKCGQVNGAAVDALDIHADEDGYCAAPAVPPVLEANGLGAQLPFGTSQADLLNRLTALWGPPTASTDWRTWCPAPVGSNDDQIATATWGALTVWFDRRSGATGSFAAYWYGSRDRSRPATLSPSVSTSAGIGLGAAVADVRAKTPGVTFAPPATIGRQSSQLTRWFVGADQYHALDGDLSADASAPGAVVTAIFAGTDAYHPLRECD